MVNEILFPQRVSDILHSGLREVPEQVSGSYPAELVFATLPPLVDPSVPKRLMTCMLAALRANGEPKELVDSQLSAFGLFMN